MRFTFGLFLLSLVCWACVKKPPQPSPKTFCSVGDLPANLQNGLVAFYPFCGNANDASINHNDGAIAGATLVSDRSGKPSSAYSFNGIDNKITIPDNVVLNVSYISISL